MKALGRLALGHVSEEELAVEPDGGRVALVFGFHRRSGYLANVPVNGTVSCDSGSGCFYYERFYVVFEEWWWRAGDRLSSVRYL